MAVARAAAAQPCLPTSEAATRAIAIECELQLLGGCQDQWAAAMGGVNSFRFGAETQVRRLIVDPAKQVALQNRLTLVKPPGTRRSSDIVGSVIQRFRRNTHNVRLVLGHLNTTSRQVRFCSPLSADFSHQLQ